VSEETSLFFAWTLSAVAAIGVGERYRLLPSVAAAPMLAGRQDCV
jgi:hypothetical protein